MSEANARLVSPKRYELIASALRTNIGCWWVQF